MTCVCGRWAWSWSNRFTARQTNSGSSPNRVGSPEAEASGYPNEALTGCRVQPASSRLGLGSPGLQSRGGRVFSAAVTVVRHPRAEFMHTLEPRSLLSRRDFLVLRIRNTPTHFGEDPRRKRTTLLEIPDGSHLAALTLTLSHAGSLP